MRNAEKLKETLCHEIDTLAEKRDLSMSDLEKIEKMTTTVKNLYKIDTYEGGGYSGAGDWEARGSYARGGSYDDGRSYANRGEHFVRGHYSRDGYPERMSERDRMADYRQSMDGRW